MSSAAPGPGWYPSPDEPGLQREWDGQQWLEARRPVPVASPTGPGGLVIAGFVLAVLGLLGAVLGAGVFSIAGWIMCGIGRRRKPTALATAGIVLSIIGLALAIAIGVSRAFNS